MNGGLRPRRVSLALAGLDKIIWYVLRAQCAILTSCVLCVRPHHMPCPYAVHSQVASTILHYTGRRNQNHICGFNVNMRTCTRRKLERHETFMCSCAQYSHGLLMPQGLQPRPSTSCKALKRDVPRGSREGARAVERGLRGRRSCAGGRVMRAELDSSNRCCCGAAGRRAVWLESTGDFPSWRFSHLVIHNFFTHVLQDSPSSGLSGAFSREGLA